MHHRAVDAGTSMRTHLLREGVLMRISRRVVLALTLVIAAAASAGAQVLDQVPAGSWVVVKVKNLTETNTKLAGFLKDLGLDQMVPEMADPLASLKKELK